MAAYVRLSQRTDDLCACGEPVQPGKGKCRPCADKSNAAVKRSNAKDPDTKFKQFNRNTKKLVSSICMVMHGHHAQI